VDEAQQAWPEYLYSDYIAAAVRLTTVMQQRQQHLLFACVELYPHEIPLPPKGLPSLQKRIGKLGTLISTIAVMPVRDALEWYESALRQQLKVPGIGADVNVIVCGLAPEPALGRLVAGAEPPFATRWHCGPRIHHLVPMENPPEALAWLSPDSRVEARAAAREWVVARLGFDLLAYDEYLFSLVLLAPNPLARWTARYIRGNLPAGGEKIGISVQPRRGVSLSDVQVLFREKRAEGTSVLRECQLDSCGLGEIDLPQPCARSSVEIISRTRGVIGIDIAAGFWRSVSVESRLLSPMGEVVVPGRRKVEDSTTYPIVRWEPGGPRLGQSAAMSPEMRAVELKMRRATRSGEAQPDGFARGEDGDERLFFQDREKAVLSMRALIARAQKRVIFVDPFFSHIDVREFALATQYQDVVVCALVGRGENLWQRAHGNQKVAGDAFAEDLQALAEDLKRPGLPLPDVRLMGDKARTYHDRFLVIDDDVWHVGHSFNQLGQSEVSMATLLRYPDEIRDWITEDIGRATPFLEGWPVLKAQRRRISPLQCLWDFLIKAVSAGARKLGLGNATGATR
jgi:hypothetical protein